MFLVYVNSQASSVKPGKLYSQPIFLVNNTIMVQTQSAHRLLANLVELQKPVLYVLKCFQLIVARESGLLWDRDVSRQGYMVAH